MHGTRRHRATEPEESDRGLPDEAALIAAAQRDPRAFHPLYLHYVQPIYRYCYYRLGGHDVAEDATSLVFERALRSLPEFRGGQFGVWLFRIAQNAITDSYRSTRTHEPLEAVDEPVDPSPDPETIVLLADEQRLLQAALSMLAPDQRRVMELRLSDRRSTEVAAILGRTPESVRKLQERAIRRLQALLDDDHLSSEARHA